MDWQRMFLIKCQEAKELGERLKIAETILSSYLPVIGEDSGDTFNEAREV